MKLFQLIYRWLVERRNAGYDNNLRPIVPVTVPVVSVGNLLAGGTGKSPLVQLVVRLLERHGRHPAVVMRGYKRRSRGLLVVHDGSAIRTNVSRAGDEAFMHARMLAVPVVVSSDKVEAAAHAAGNMPCDVVVVDDGFQHRALYRCCDIVIVDNTTMHGELLPNGRLREPITSLKRASIVVCVGGVQPADVRALCSSNACIVSATTHVTCELPPGTRVVAVAGIAQPERFLRALEQCNYMIAATYTKRDHHRYRTVDVWRIRDMAKQHNAIVVTTEKDIAKILEADSSGDLAHTTIKVASLTMNISDDRFSQRLLQDITNEDRNLQEQNIEH